MNLEDINRFLILRFLRKIYFFLDKRSAYRMIDIGKPGSYKPLCDRNIENVSNLIYDMLQTDKPCIIRKSKFPQNPKRSVRFSGKRTKRSVQKRKARNTQKAETKVL